MKKRTIPILLAGMLLAACSPSVPDIDVAGELDMGTVRKGDMAVADLKVRNLGTGPLTVFAVNTSCGCTKATLSPMTIPAGGEAQLHVEYNSGLHESDMGRMNRLVFISSDDPDEGDVRIRVTVLVEPKTS